MMKMVDRNSSNNSKANSLKRSFVNLLPALALVLALSAGDFFRACITSRAEVAPQGDHGMGTLAGTVVNSQGKPVANASITMQNADGQSPHATTTNREGRFFFPDLPHGYYDVRASTHSARSEWKHNVEIVTGKQTEVTLRLVPKPH